MTNNTLLANVPVDLMYQALETEKGGVQIYTTAQNLGDQFVKAIARHRHWEREPAA